MELVNEEFVCEVVVTTGVSVSQDWLYTPPNPSEAIEAANSILTRRERPIDDNLSLNKFNLSEGILNGSLITPHDGEVGEEREEVIEDNATTMINDLPAVIEEFNDITDGLFKRLGKPTGREHETNDVFQEGEEGYLESLGRAIGGGGVPGADFPIHYKVPKTGFSCGDGNLVGYYADMDPKAACQVFHICQEDGRHDAFLCPIGTLFNQKYFVCDWWYNVDCNASAEYYSLNEFLIREISNRGFKPININLRNRTESFEQIIKEIRNVKTDSTLFANKHNTGSRLFSNLNSTAEVVDDQFMESAKGASQSRENEDESLGMENIDGNGEVEAEKIVETELAEKLGEKDKKIDEGSEKEEKLQKGYKNGNKDVKTVKEEQENNSDNAMKVVIEGEEGKSKSSPDTIEEKRTSNKEVFLQSEQERRGEENFSKTEDSIQSETKVNLEKAKKSNGKNKDNKKETTKSNDKYQDGKKENVAANKANRIGLQNGLRTSNLGEPLETPSESKDRITNGIKKNGVSSTTLNDEVPSKVEEVIGYSYKNPKDGNEIENILNKKNPSLNSYGVVTDNLVNKKGIRN